MADTPGFPDTNCTMFIDPEERLWLMWPTIMANRWESALMKYQNSTDYLGKGAPEWSVSKVLHIKPGEKFVDAVENWVAAEEAKLQEGVPAGIDTVKAAEYLAGIRAQANDKLTRRLGWMTRAHPFVLDGKRLIVPLYSDGFSF